jgi:hypothetical protein
MSGVALVPQHCRIELSKSQASVKNSRLQRRAMAPKLRYVHIPGLAVRRRLSCENASVTSALRQHAARAPQWRQVTGKWPGWGEMT